MADYYQILAHAVAALDPNTREGRELLYDRARKVLADRRQSDPALSDADFRAAGAALEAAIRRVESEAASHAAPPPSTAVDAGAVGEDDAALSFDDEQDRPPLNRDRARFVAGVVGVLVVLLAGGLAYYYWPHDIRSTARSIVRAAPVADPNEDRIDRTSYIYMRQLVYYRTNYPVGTIVVDKQQSFLYFVKPRLAAMRYTVRISDKCSELGGLFHVIRKEEWPGWTPPAQNSAAGANDRIMSPLGARALDLNNKHRIHGTSAVPVDARDFLKRCIGLVNDDVIDLYNHTPVGSRVVVLSPALVN